MTPKQQAISDVYEGKQVQCTSEEYQHGLRSALQEAAGKWIDKGQDIRAILALEEVKRLDKLHNFTF